MKKEIFSNAIQHLGRRDTYSSAATRVWQSAVFWGFFSTALRLGGFVLVLPFALRRLSSDYLGIWYTMQSISGLVVMMEIGFSPCIGRFASYYFAGAKKVPRLGVDEVSATADSKPNLPALAGLVVMARRLYRGFAIAAFILMGLGGSLWLAAKFGRVFLHADVVGAYILFSGGIAVMMSGFFWGDLLYGTHQVRGAFRNLIYAQLLNYVVTVALFLWGFGLMSLAFGQLILALLPRWLARRQFLSVLPVNQMTEIQPTAVRDLWPICWRSGLGAVASCLLFRNMTLVSAQVLDLRSTASLGLTIQLCAVVSGISQIWLSVKYPVITGLRSRRDEIGLRRLVNQRVPWCLATYMTGAVVLLTLAPWAIHLMGSRTPVLPTPLFALLLGVCGLDLYMGLNTAIMLTANRTPFLVPYLISGIATALVGVVLGYNWGIIGIIVAPVLVQLCWNYWWTPLARLRSMKIRASSPLEVAA